MNGFAALCTFIATFSPPFGEPPVTTPSAITEPTDIAEHLQAQDARIKGPRIHGVIYLDAPISSSSRRILR